MAFFMVYDIESKQEREGHYNVVPDTCPLCHHAIDPIFIKGFLVRRAASSTSQLQIIFRCTKHDCSRVFISYYEDFTENTNYFILKGSLPKNLKRKEFSKIIKETSLKFCEIFNEASFAEQIELTQICGPGYRKALEFLIKDYLIKRNPSDTDQIKKKSLGSCISDNIDDARIKEVAERAVWIGNDETHYLRVWEDKDLDDLKKLIHTVTNWIEIVEETEEIKKSMKRK